MRICTARKGSGVIVVGTKFVGRRRIEIQWLFSRHALNFGEELDRGYKALEMLCWQIVWQRLNVIGALLQKKMY